MERALICNPYQAKNICPNGGENLPVMFWALEAPRQNIIRDQPDIGQQGTSPGHNIRGKEAGNPVVTVIATSVTTMVSTIIIPPPPADTSSGGDATTTEADNDHEGPTSTIPVRSSTSSRSTTSPEPKLTDHTSMSLISHFKGKVKLEPGNCQCAGCPTPIA
jgi:hypothetical protein